MAYVGQSCVLYECRRGEGKRSVWKCSECSHSFDAERNPTYCPECGRPARSLERLPSMISDAKHGLEFETIFIRESLLQEVVDRKVRCNVCERRCLLAAGGTGWCCTRQNRAGRLVTLTYGA